VNVFFEKIHSLISKQRNSGILLGNEVVDQPFQTNFLSLTNEQLRTSLLSDFMNAEQSNDGKYQNLEEMLLKRYGRSMCETFLFPYNRKLYGDLTKLSVDSMGRFFPNTTTKDIDAAGAKQTGYNSTMYHPNNKKFSSILQNLDMQWHKISLNNEITNINLEQRLVTTNKDVYHYRNLVSTIPLKTFLYLIGDKEKADKLQASSLTVFNMQIATSQSPLSSRDWLYIPSDKYPFFRVGSYSNILQKEFFEQRIYVECPDKTKKEDVVAGLKDIGIIKVDKDIYDCVEIRLEDAYNLITPESEKIVRELSYPKVFFAGRYGRWGYGGVEDNFEDGLKTAEMIK